MMTKMACQYAIIQFIPHPERREFVNVGVVLLCSQDNFFGFRILDRYERITHFFKELNSQIYIDGKRIFQNEMMRIQKTILAGNAGKKDDVSINRIRLFVELTKKREGYFVLTHQLL